MVAVISTIVSSSSSLSSSYIDFFQSKHRATKEILACWMIWSAVLASSLPVAAVTAFIGIQQQPSSFSSSFRRSRNPMIVQRAATTRQDQHGECRHSENDYLDQYLFEAKIARQEIHGVTLKIATDRRGGVADLAETKSERFTCPESLDMVHRLRRDCDAVLVGRTTVERDDCTLTVRRVPPKTIRRVRCHDENDGDDDNKDDDDDPGKEQPIQPVRVVVDPRRQLALEQLQIAKDGLDTLIYYHDPDMDGEVHPNHDASACYSYERDEQYPNVQWIGMAAAQPYKQQQQQQDDNESNTAAATGSSRSDSPPNDCPTRIRLSAKDIVRDLKFHQGLWHIMVEGGPATAEQFLNERLIDRAILVRAPMEFQDPVLPSRTFDRQLREAGLERIHHGTLGVDDVEYWSKPGLPWPKSELGEAIWP